jgi:PKD repeat protein
LATAAGSIVQPAPITQQGVAITGYYKNSANTATMMNRTMIMVVNGLGAEVWRNIYPTMGTQSTDEGWDIVQNAGSNYEFAVAGQQGFSGGRSIYFVRASAAGAPLCETLYNTGTAPSPDMYARAISLSAQDPTSYVMAGPNAQTNNTFLMQTSACNGLPTWVQEYPLTANHPTAAESIQRITNTTNGGYFVSTHALGINTNFDPHILSTDNTGNIAYPNCPANQKSLQAQGSQGYTTLTKCQTQFDYVPTQVFVDPIQIAETPCPNTQNPCQNSTLTASINPNNMTICTGASVSLNVIASGGVAPYVYNWSNGGVSSTTTATPTSNTVYIVTVTDANGCTATATVTITVNPLPTITISGTTQICFGTTTTLTASGGIVYLWSTGGTTASETVGIGTYTVSVTDAFGCMSTQSVTVAGYCCLAPTITSTPIGCNSFQFTVSGVATCTAASSYTYNFGDASPIVSTPSNAIAHSYALPGTYTACVTVTQNCGGVTCTATICTTITTTAGPTVSIFPASAATGCPGQCFLLAPIGSPAGGTYAWLPAGSGTVSASGVLTVCATGVYTVVYTDANGCTATASVSIISTPPPTVTITTTATTVCPNGCVTLTATGSPVGGSFAWSGGGTAATVTYCGGGTYTVTYTNSAGCSVTRSITIGVSPAPTVAIAASKTTICPNECSTLTPTGTPTGGTFTWSSGTPTAAGLLTVCTAGTYTVTYTSTAGCTATASVTITASTNCCSNFTITDMKYIVHSYQRSVLTYTPTTTGCTAGSTLSYFWDFGDGFTSTLPSPSRVYAAAGVYTICVTVTCTSPNGQVCRYRCCRTITIPDNCPNSVPTFTHSVATNGLDYTFSGVINTNIAPNPIATSVYTITNSAGVVVFTSPVAPNNVLHNLTYSFTTPGTYTICRTVSRVANANFGNYCEAKFCRTVTVVASPCTAVTSIPRYSAIIRTQTPLTVTLTSVSAGASTVNWSYATTPAGPFTAMGAVSPLVYTFPTYGTYWVKLVINQGTPCEFSVTHRIELQQPSCAPYNGVFPPPAGSRAAVGGDVTELTSGETLVPAYDEKAPPSVQPNPTNGIFNLMLNKFSEQETTINIINLQGAVLQTQKIYSGTASTEFDLSQYPSGLYLVTMQAANGERVTQKVVKE